MKHSEAFEKVKKLILSGNVRVSEHGYDELANDSLLVREIVSSVESGIAVEDYPNYPKGLQFLFYKMTYSEILYMLFGGFPKDMTLPLFW